MFIIIPFVMGLVAFYNKNIELSVSLSLGLKIPLSHTHTHTNTGRGGGFPRTNGKFQNYTPDSTQDSTATHTRVTAPTIDQ